MQFMILPLLKMCTASVHGHQLISSYLMGIPGVLYMTAALHYHDLNDDVLLPTTPCALVWVYAAPIHMFHVAELTVVQ